MSDWKGVIANRFWDKVDLTSSPDGCWLWTGAVRSPDAPYGAYWEGGRTVLAHRVAYEALVGPIPEGLTIDHLCGIKNCVNPDHLEPVTLRENTLRGDSPIAQQARQTHCKRGHPLSGDNLYIAPGTGFRACRICRQEANLRSKEAARG